MILFLDFDGVISTCRAFNAQREMEDFYLRWIDPVAAKLVRRLCQDHGLQIVVTSTWRGHKNGSCEDVLAAHGLAEFLHEDWRTRDLWVRGDSKGSRPVEIDDWLARNGYQEYIILDDDSFDWTRDQYARWVKTHQLDGLSTEQYDMADEYLRETTGAERT